MLMECSILLMGNTVKWQGGDIHLIILPVFQRNAENDFGQNWHLMACSFNLDIDFFSLAFKNISTSVVVVDSLGEKELWNRDESSVVVVVRTDDTGRLTVAVDWSAVIIFTAFTWHRFESGDLCNFLFNFNERLCWYESHSRKQ